jgi:transposase-like protein
MTKKGAVAARTAAVKRRTFTREFKLKVIREVEAGKSQAQVAREYQNHRQHNFEVAATASAVSGSSLCWSRPCLH